MKFEDMSHFAHPHALLAKSEKILKKVGPKKFFDRSDEEAQKAFEAFVAFFFVMALQKATGRTWWANQPSTFPDLELISYGTDPEGSDILIQQVEVVTVPERCNSYEEMRSIVLSKIFKKKYAQSKNMSLLIFVNNKNSKEWIPKLFRELKSTGPFKEIWTTHLLFNKGGIASTVVNRLRPLPHFHHELNFEDMGSFSEQPLPPYLEKIEYEGKSFLKFKPEFEKKLRRKILALKKRFSPKDDHLCP